MSELVDAVIEAAKRLKEENEKLRRRVAFLEDALDWALAELARARDEAWGLRLELARLEAAYTELKQRCKTDKP